jgi:tryptophan-rich sensory protein
MSRRTRSIPALVISIVTCLLVGISGSLLTATSVTTWYTQIQKPSWTPPDAVFGPVWTLLYVMMGVSAWLFWRDSAGDVRRRGLSIFALQLLLNSLWSLLFFGMQSPGWAAIEIVVLWGAIAATIIVFAKVGRAAALLLVPYLLWVSFASALNFSIWNLDR